MVWGGISHGHKSLLIITDGYLTGVHYRVYVRTSFSNTIMPDLMLPWSVMIILQLTTWKLCTGLLSPNLSAIEHLWDVLDRRVRRRNPAPDSIPQLRQALLEEWDNIPMAT